jgi:DNA-binding response OmpR family regulator
MTLFEELFLQYTHTIMQETKILWADDEINLLKPHILLLNEKGYHVTTFTNGNDALEAFGKV